jgi:type IV pilus assembly protein PilN
MNNRSLAAINLASQPFRRERAQNIVLALVCVGLVCSSLLGLSLIFSARRHAEDIRREISTEQAELQKLRQDEGGFAAFLAKPDNSDVFSRNVFLNELIARRAVSWTVVFRDLEKTLPANMRLEGLRLPQVSGQDSTGTNRVLLDMIVGTAQPETFIELLKRLQQSPLFGAAQVLGQQPPTQNDPLFKFRVTVAYAQKL